MHFGENFDKIELERESKKLILMEQQVLRSKLKFSSYK